MKETPGMKIKQLRQEKGVTQQQLADAIGISRVAVSKWESGETKDLKRENLIGIAKFFNMTLAEVLGVEEKPNVITGINIESGRRHYPVISYVQAGAWREIVDTFEPGDAESYRLAESGYGKHTFGLVIVGNSMEPDFKEGDVVFIDPDVSPRPGDFVVARNSEQEATFKKYRPRGLDANNVPIFELVPLNDDYATLRSDQQHIQIIGTMVEHTRYRR